MRAAFLLRRGEHKKVRLFTRSAGTEQRVNEVTGSAIAPE